MAVKKTDNLTPLLTVEPNDIFTVTKEGVVYLGANPMAKEELKSLQEEIKFLEKTHIWGILTATVADEAKRIMFERSETFEDMRTGKAILRSISLFKRICAQLKSVNLENK